MKMEIKITKEMERVFTLSEVPAIESLRNSLKDEPEFDWEAKRIAEIASGSSIEVLRYELEMVKNNRVWNFYGSSNEEDVTFPTWNLDVWIHVLAYDELTGFYDIGAYLSDIWSLRSDNEDEVKSHMYIRKFVEQR